MDRADDVSKLRDFAGYVSILFFNLISEAHHKYSHFQLGFKKHVLLSRESSFLMKITSLVGDGVCKQATL